MLTPQQKAAIAALNNSGILSAALEALKERLIRDMMYTDVHESKKREDCYMKYRLIGDLKEVIVAATNDSEVRT
ncbi:hypothetical protein [Herbiconiux daphne]|uniref:Uncharacterized protein n=1 Tax=Herbiconiux daphne TaxID=2970914 RepID=A0ABT2HAJ8_9MICO|nr:hypothetical protein [Herbiconiux daphne]MCS5736971.1 hypothetical protein [Herbiconiux daphne]